MHQQMEEVEQLLQQLRQKYAQLITSAASCGAKGAPGTPSHDMGGALDATGCHASKVSDIKRHLRELDAEKQQLEAELHKVQAREAQEEAQEKAQEDAQEDRLITAISTNMGFSKGRPVAALVVFRCCLEWHSYQAERTSIFNCIIQVIGGQIEKQQDDNGCLAYWLTNTVTLLHLLHKHIKPASNSRFNNSSAAGRLLGGLFARSVQPGEASVDDDGSGGVGGFQQVEAKYPALLFKQQIDAFVQKVFPLIRDNVKKQITPMLAGCIHTPTGRAAGSGTSVDPSHAQGVSKHWQDLLGALDRLLAALKENHVPVVLVQALFKQLFIFVNVQLFNQLLLRRECCSFENAEHVKAGLGHVEQWIGTAGKEYMGGSLDELCFIRQATAFLASKDKQNKTLDDIMRGICPQLSVQQLFRISTQYRDDRHNTETVSVDVLSRMQQLIVDDNSSTSTSFLLDYDFEPTFLAQEVLSQMDDTDLYAGLPTPEQLKEEGSTSFAFLDQHLQINPQSPATT